MGFVIILPVIGLALSAAAPLDTPKTANDSAAPIRIGYSDLDLSSSDGVRTLHLRIERAIDSACWRSAGDLATSQSSIACKVDAWRQVRPRMDRVIAQRGSNMQSVQAASRD